MSLEQARALRIQINEAQRDSWDARKAYDRAVTELGQRGDALQAAEERLIELRRIWDALPIEVIADLAYTPGGIRGGS
jgi:hypothetical protein